jgi:predicted nucleic-acid-binding Zn-ribbon protein
MLGSVFLHEDKSEGEMMEDDFKCKVCESTEYHTREIEEGKTTDKIIDLRNPKLNARIVLKACAGCHMVFAYWEDFQSAADIPQKEKDISNQVLAEGENP